MRVIQVSFAAALVLGGLALWWMSGERESPPFSIGSRKLQLTREPSFAVGLSFASMVSPDGRLWLWGAPQRAGIKLGGHTGMTPVLLSTAQDWQQVVAGFFCLAALKDDGTIWVMGQNAEGALGLSPGTKEVSKLTQMGSDRDWKELSAGVAHCLALKRDGTLWAWGKNSDGQIGTGYLSPAEQPRQVGTNQNWVAISAGGMASFAMQADGTIWAWGMGTGNQGNNPAPTQLGQGVKWQSFSAGEYHVVALDVEGRMWAAGENAHLLESGINRRGDTNLVLATNEMRFESIRATQFGMVGRTKGGKWGNLGKAPWWLPDEVQPLRFHSQQGTTLMLMEDGKVWSVGRRIGSTAPEPFLERMQRVVRAALGNGQPPNDTEIIDERPWLVWEMPE